MILRFALLATACTLLGCKADIRDRDLKTIPVIEARRLSHAGAVDAASGTAGEKGAIVMDARPANAYAAAHIPGAINVRIDAVDTDLPPNPAWTRAPAIIVYGDDHGSAAARALARRLMEVGYKNVRLLEGGFAGWRETGLPVTGT